VWFLIQQVTTFTPWKALIRICTLVSLGIILNLGFWYRNIITYETPIGPISMLESHVNSKLSLSYFLSQLIKQVSLQFATPFEHWNDSLTRLITMIHAWLGIELGSLEAIWSWNHEDLAGNPLHLAAILISITLLVLHRSKAPPSYVRFAVVVTSSFSVYLLLVNTNQYSARLQLPGLFLWAPLVGLQFSKWISGRFAKTLIVLALISGLPWVILNRSRPLIDARPRTMTQSIFTEPAGAILFANWSSLRDDYLEAAKVIQLTGCTQIGLSIDSHDIEYPIWKLLGSPKSDLVIEHIDPYPHLRRYEDRTFQPCIILCTICGDRTVFHGLPLTEKIGDISIFSGAASGE